MNRGEHVVLQNTLRDQDRVFVVVPVPRHERDDDVPANGQFAHIGTGAIGHNFAAHNRIANLHQRALVDAGRLVGAFELAQTVDVDAGFTRFHHLGRTHNDPAGVNLIDDTRTTGHNGSARVAGNDAFDPGADKWRVRPHQRHSLTHHVRAHEGAVGVVVFEERNQGGRNRHKLLGRYVDQIHGFGRVEHEFPGFPCGNQIIHKAPFIVQLRVGLRHGVTHFFGRGHIDHVVGDLAVHNLAIRGLDEAILVDPREGREAVDQTNVLTFRRFNRAHPAIMGRVNVAHFKARAFACQTARPKGRKTALVRDFRQRVGLVHELRQLRRAEEFAYRSRSRFRVDQVLRHDRVDLDRRHAFLDRPLHPEQTDAVLVFHQFADRPDATVAEVVDVVNLTLAIAQFGQRLDAGDDVITVQRALGVGLAQIQTHVHLDAANGRKVVTLAIEEQRIEQLACRFNGRRFTRTHDAVDIHERGIAAHVLVGSHGVADVGADVHAVDVQHRNLGDALIQQNLQASALHFAVLVIFHRQFVASFDPNLAGFFIDDVLGNIAAKDLVKRHQLLFDLTFVDDLLDHPRRHLVARFAQDFACGRIHQIIGRAGAAHTFREEPGDPTLVLFVLVADGIVIRIHDAFLIQTQGIKQGRDRQFPATVDPRENDVLGVKLEVEPGAAVRNDPAGEQQLARGMRLALVMVKEHARRAVHLADDHAFGTVHDERAVLRHQGHVAHEHVLFLDVLDRPCAGIFIDIKHDQTQRHLERRGIGHVAALTFVNVVFRLLQFVFHEFQNSRFIKVLDREYRLEHALNTVPIGRLRAIARLQEQVVRGFLNLDKVRHFQHFTDFTKVPADSLLTNVALSHAHRHLSSFRRHSPVGPRDCAARR